VLRWRIASSTRLLGSPRYRPGEGRWAVGTAQGHEMSLREMACVKGPHCRLRGLPVCFALFVAVVCAVSAAPVGAGVVAPSPAYSLRLDSEPAPLIAGHRVGTFGRAVETFGQPRTISSVAQQPVCEAAWPRIGLRISFSATREGLCVEKTLGSWRQVAALTPRWHTDGGLRVGDPAARLHALYPQARRLDFVGAGIWELEDGGPPCDGGLPLVIAARLERGVVRSLTILHIPACG
jgi:hypothetical protein